MLLIENQASSRTMLGSDTRATSSRLTMIAMIDHRSARHPKTTLGVKAAVAQHQHGGGDEQEGEQRAHRDQVIQGAQRDDSCGDGARLPHSRIAVRGDPDRRSTRPSAAGNRPSSAIRSMIRDWVNSTASTEDPDGYRAPGLLGFLGNAADHVEADIGEEHDRIIPVRPNSPNVPSFGKTRDPAGGVPVQVTRRR